MESHARLQFHHSIRSAALSPTADLLAILNDQGLLSLHLFNGTSLWHTPLFLPTGVLPGGTNVSCRWSPDGSSPVDNISLRTHEFRLLHIG